MNYISSITEAIGHTPLLKLNKIKASSGANVFVKLEHLNPSGSYKDRMALSMIEGAEKGDTWNGRKLGEGWTVVEASAGNTAPAVAMVCAARGYKAKFVLYRYQINAKADARMIITSAYGPDVVVSSPPDTYLTAEQVEGFTAREPDMPHVMAAKMDCALMEASDSHCVWVDQIYNKYNYIGQKNMAKEIYEQLDGKIDAIGCSVGAGGSLFGLCLGLEELGIHPITFGAVPNGSECYIEAPKEENTRDEYKVSSVRFEIAKAMGLDKWVEQKSIIHQMVESGYPDIFFRVSNEDAKKMADRLCQEEGIYCGMSSGANVAVALRIAERMKPGQNVVTTIVDRRDRYITEVGHEKYVV